VDIQSLKDLGYTDEDVLEATEVIALFNFLDRIADALGAPVENMQQAMSMNFLGVRDRGNYTLSLIA